MELSDLLLQIEQIQQRLLSVGPRLLRPIFRGYGLQDKRAALIIGPRGAGKTTLLLESVRDHNILYLCADHPMISGINLYDLAQEAFGKGYDGIAIDEVNFSNQWSGALKAIYDSYPSKKVWASDSSSIKLKQGIADLSRRFPRVSLPLLSFREYIFFKENVLVDPFHPWGEQSSAKAVFDKVNVLSLFHQYLKEGARPIFLEGDYQERLLNIIEKMIFSDTPFLLPRIQEQYLKLMNAVIGYLASSPIPTLNVDSLSTEWSIGKEKLYELLSVLEHIGLIHIVRYQHDHKASGKGAKILLADPTMYEVLKGDKGNVREAFFVTSVRGANKPIFACKDESKGDFIVEGMLFEIGGKKKKRKASDFVVRDDIELPLKNVLPLWSLGFLY